MPWQDISQSAAFFTIAGQGPVAQTSIVQDLPPLLPTTIVAAGNFTTGIVVSDGYKVITASVISTQAGALVIQRYLDRAGTIPIAAISSTIAGGAALVFANVPQQATPDNLPFASFSITVTNTSGATATLTSFYVLMQAF
jgi:hypothetical protein